MCAHARANIDPARREILPKPREVRGHTTNMEARIVGGAFSRWVFLVLIRHSAGFARSPGSPAPDCTVSKVMWCLDTIPGTTVTHLHQD